MLRILNAGFSGLTPGQLADKAAAIIAALTGNASFTTTSPTLAVVQAALDALNAAIAMPPGQSRDAAITSTRDTLETLLQDLATNLEQTPNVTEAMLATSGFDLRKDRQRSNDPPDIPRNLRLKGTGTSGEVQALFEASNRATGYQVQTTNDPNNGPWQDHDPFSSTRGVVLRGLERAKDVWVRVRALGPNNTRSGWSDPATILVS